jgi:hypothetical protein
VLVVVAAVVVVVAVGSTSNTWCAGSTAGSEGTVMAKACGSKVGCGGRH